jgi:hypothetical protein
MRFGFTIESWEILAQALLAHAAAYDVVSTSEKSDVTNYVIEGALDTPDKRQPLTRCEDGARWYRNLNRLY